MNIPILILDDMSSVPGVAAQSDYIANILRNQQEYRDHMKAYADKITLMRACPLDDDKL